MEMFTFVFFVYFTIVNDILGSLVETLGTACVGDWDGITWGIFTSLLLLFFLCYWGASDWSFTTCTWGITFDLEAWLGEGGVT